MASSTSSSPSDRPSIWRFLISRVFWLNALIAVVVLLIGLLVAMRALQHYTDHNQAITVPDCTGLTLEQASGQLDRKDLRWAVMDSFYDPRQLPLTVLGQFPQEGAAVKEGRVVHLTVNRIRPQMVEVPVAELEEKTLRSVQFTLQGLGFRLGELIYQPGVYDNQVLEIRANGSAEALEQGQQLPKGSMLDLLVTDGYGNTRVALPNLEGMGWSEAAFVLRAHNLVEGNVVYDPDVDSVAAKVYRQSPIPGDNVYVKEGSMINVWLGVLGDTLSTNPAESLPAQR